MKEKIHIKRAHTNLDLFMERDGIKTIKELSVKLDLSEGATYQRLDNDISMDTLKRLSTLFGVSVKEFLR